MDTEDNGYRGFKQKIYQTVDVNEYPQYTKRKQKIKQNINMHINKVTQLLRSNNTINDNKYKDNITKCATFTFVNNKIRKSQNFSKIQA